MILMRRVSFSWSFIVLVIAMATSPAAAQDRAECVQKTGGLAVAQLTYEFVLADGSKDRVTGSGFVIKSDGHILTAAHVLRPPAVYTSPVVNSKIDVRVGSPFATPVPATLITKQDDLDVALIKIPAMPQPWPTVQIDMMPGDHSKTWLYALGYPDGSDLTGGGPGKVTAANAVIANKPTGWWQTDVDLRPGMSGGPVFNDFGEVAGLAGAIRGGNGGTISYVIPISTAATLIPLAGLTDYTPSQCADDPAPFVMAFIESATENTFDPKNISPPLYQTILAQAPYPVFAQLGPIVSTEIPDKRSIPQGTWYTIKATHQNGKSLWVIGYNRITKQIDSSAMTPQVQAALPVCTPAVLRAFNVPDTGTLDGNGSTVGQLSEISGSIIQECVGPNNTPQYRFHLAYGYYNGSGTWRGDQSITVNFRSAQGVSLLAKSFPLDRSKCVYGGPEKRSADAPLEGGIGSLISDISLQISRVSGTQTGC